MAHAQNTPGDRGNGTGGAPTEPFTRNAFEPTGGGASSAGDQAAAGLAALVGYRLPGQCEHCDAEGEVVPDLDHPRLFHLRIYHADSCPVLRERHCTHD